MHGGVHHHRGADGLYYHLYKYRLYERPASRLEHQLHTANVTIFVPQVFLLFWMQPHGLWLWLALLTFVASLVVEFFDVLCEPASRRDLGACPGWSTCCTSLRWRAAVRGGAAALCHLAPADWTMSATAMTPGPLWFLLVGVYIGVPAIGISAPAYRAAR